MFWSFLGIFDLFRLPMTFYFNGFSKRTSALGFLSSLIIYGYLFYSFFQSNLYLKVNPIVVEQNIQNQHADVIQFGGSGKFIAFGVADVLNNRFIDPTIFSVEFRYFHNISYYEVLPLRPCTLDDVNGNQSYYELFSLAHCFCPKNPYFFLEGTIDENPHYISVNLFLCNNATSNKTCKNQSVIDNFFNSFTSQKVFSVVYDDLQVIIDDYNDPFKKLNKGDFQIIDQAVKKRSVNYFKKSTVVTDSGWLFPNLNSQSNFMFSMKEFDFQMRLNPNQPIFQYLFFSSKDEIRYNRRYQTVAEFLGGFAGVAKFISIICSILVNNFVYFNTFKHILNKIYVFPNYAIKKDSRKKVKTNKKVDSTTKSQPKFTLAETTQITQNLQTMNEKDFEKSQKQYPIETIENQLFTKGDENEKIGIIKTIPDILKKELDKDSFVLEHFSERSNHPKEEKTTTIVEKKTINLKSMEIQSSVVLPKSTREGPQKRKMKDRIISFFKRRKNDEMNKKLKISYWEYVSLVVSDVFKKKKSLNHMLIQKAEQTYKKDLDIESLVRKLHDLDKLKILLLDEDQLVLFNYLSKPIINLDIQNKEVEESLSLPQRKVGNLMDREKNADLYLEDSYSKVSKKNDKISKNLIDFFDREICQLGAIKLEKK